MGRGPNSKTSPGARPAGASGRVARPLLATALTLAAAAALLAGLAWLGDAALRRLGPRDRYRAHFADILCETPPGLDRPAFLAEVRYAGQFPETFNALDPAHTARLTAAFAAHPWVEAVGGVAVEPAAVVRVRLTFRKPFLAVRLADVTVRTVDAAGVLLPVSDAPPGLAELDDPVPEPATPAGQVWADETVKRAVELVKAYHPRRLNKTPQGWRLTRSDGTVLAVGGE